jgi:hypothetical protein
MQYRVILQWGQSDEGNYCDVFDAPDEKAAKRMCAEQMFDEYPNMKEDYTPEEREQWILDRMNACDDICTVRDLDVHVRALMDAATKLLSTFGGVTPGQRKAAADMEAAIVAAQLALGD